MGETGFEFEIKGAKITLPKFTTANQIGEIGFYSNLELGPEAEEKLEEIAHKIIVEKINTIIKSSIIFNVKDGEKVLLSIIFHYENEGLNAKDGLHLVDFFHYNCNNTTSEFDEEKFISSLTSLIKRVCIYNQSYKEADIKILGFKDKDYFKRSGNTPSCGYVLMQPETEDDAAIYLPNDGIHAKVNYYPKDGTFDTNLFFYHGTYDHVKGINEVRKHPINIPKEEDIVSTHLVLSKPLKMSAIIILSQILKDNHLIIDGEEDIYELMKDFKS